MSIQDELAAILSNHSQSQHEEERFAVPSQVNFSHQVHQSQAESQYIRK